MYMTASLRIRAMRVVVVLLQSLVLTWALVALGNAFGWNVGPPSLY